MSYNQEFWDGFVRSRIVEDPKFEFIEIGNYRCRIPDKDSKLVGIVSHIQSSRVDDDLREIDNIFEGRPYYLEIRAQDQPDNLPEIIEEHGFEKHLSLQRRYLELTTEHIEEVHPDNYNIAYIKQIDRNKVTSDEIFELKKSIFPSTTTTKERYVKAIQKRYETASLLNEEIFHFIYQEDQQLLGMGNLIIMGRYKGKNIAFLNGAGTKEEYRKQGIYRSLVYHRCKVAKSMGVDLIYTEARAETSSKLLNKFGFELVDTYTYYRPK